MMEARFYRYTLFSFGSIVVGSQGAFWRERILLVSCTSFGFSWFFYEGRLRRAKFMLTRVRYLFSERTFRMIIRCCQIVKLLDSRCV